MGGLAFGQGYFGQYTLGGIVPPTVEPLADVIVDIRADDVTVQVQADDDLIQARAS